jgi:hypothetical protein
MDLLRKIEIEILNAVQYDLFPVDGAPSEGKLEFLDATHFGALSLLSMSHTTSSEPSRSVSRASSHQNSNAPSESPMCEEGVTMFKDFTVSTKTLYEREIMHYWQVIIICEFVINPRV